MSSFLFFKQGILDSISMLKSNYNKTLDDFMLMLIHFILNILFECFYYLKDSNFQSWLYAKIINGERASYRSPKFASMQVCVKIFRFLWKTILLYKNVCQTKFLPKAFAYLDNKMFFKSFINYGWEKYFKYGIKWFWTLRAIHLNSLYIPAV